MHAPKTKTLTTVHGGDQLFSALAQTVAEGDYTETARDDATRRLEFSSGKTALSWGHEYIATVTQGGSGAELEVVCGGLDDKPKALLDGVKNSRAAEKVLAGVKAKLPG